MPEPVVLGCAGWLLHLAIAGLVVLAISFLARDRLRLEPWEGLIFLVPFALWLVASTTTTFYRKSWLNLLLEPAMIGVAIALAMCLRAVSTTHGRQTTWAIWLFVAVVVVALAVARLTPPLAP